MRRHGHGGPVAVPAFDTTRKARWVAESLGARPIAGVVLETPAPVTVDDLAAVHDRMYVDAVRTSNPPELAESSGLTWDPPIAWPPIEAPQPCAAHPRIPLPGITIT